MNYPKTYLDADDVERGHYVYAHKCKRTDTIFYVGKGKNARAWSDRRSRQWHEHVKKLEDGYEVVLLHQDLTEEEAINLERIEIEKNGGCASQGGRLINWIPGDAGNGFGVAFTISFSLGEASKNDALSRIGDLLLDEYRRARQFKELTKIEKDSLKKKFEEIVSPTLEPIESSWERFALLPEYPPEYPRIFDDFRLRCYDIYLLAHRIGRRKIKYSDFCEAVDQEIDSLELAMNCAKEENASDADVMICKRAYDAVIDWCRCFAERSREDAKKASDTLEIRLRFPAGAAGDHEFAKYISAVKAFFGERRAEDLLSLRAELLTTGQLTDQTQPAFRPDT